MNVTELVLLFSGWGMSFMAAALCHKLYRELTATRNSGLEAVALRLADGVIASTTIVAGLKSGLSDPVVARIQAQRGPILQSPAMMWPGSPETAHDGPDVPISTRHNEIPPGDGEELDPSAFFNTGP